MYNENFERISMLMLEILKIKLRGLETKTYAHF